MRRRRWRRLSTRESAARSCPRCSHWRAPPSLTNHWSPPDKDEPACWSRRNPQEWKEPTRRCRSPWKWYSAEPRRGDLPAARGSRLTGDDLLVGSSCGTASTRNARYRQAVAYVAHRDDHGVRRCVAGPTAVRGSRLSDRVGVGASPVERELAEIHAPGGTSGGAGSEGRARRRDRG